MDAQPRKKLLRFVVDVSGSMYRFNGQDGRLDRMLETCVMLMEVRVLCAVSVCTFCLCASVCMCVCLRDDGGGVA